MIQTTRFLNPPAVARILGTSAEQVLAFIRSGELKASNTSLGERKRWKVNPADLEKFLDARSNRPKPTQQRKQSAPTSTREYV